MTQGVAYHVRRSFERNSGLRLDELWSRGLAAIRLRRGPSKCGAQRVAPIFSIWAARPRFLMQPVCRSGWLKLTGIGASQFCRVLRSWKRGEVEYIVEGKYKPRASFVIAELQAAILLTAERPSARWDSYPFGKTLAEIYTNWMHSFATKAFSNLKLMTLTMYLS